MLKTHTGFNPDAERIYYEADISMPPTLEELDLLETDVHHWIPEPQILFTDKRVLDIGAGKAPLGTLIAKRFMPASVTSFELVFHRLQTANTWKQKLKNFSLVCGDAFMLPFQNESFDYVVANSVLHHLPNVEQAIAEIGRVLHIGGSYIGREPNFNNPFVRFAIFAGPNLSQFIANHTANEYPLRAQEITRAFSAAGCHCQIHYFWRRLPLLHHPTFSVSMSVRAKRVS